MWVEKKLIILINIYTFNIILLNIPLVKLLCKIQFTRELAQFL